MNRLHISHPKAYPGRHDSSYAMPGYIRGNRLDVANNIRIHFTVVLSVINATLETSQRKRLRGG
jgi:hypothetical protein